MYIKLVSVLKLLSPFLLFVIVMSGGRIQTCGLVTVWYNYFVTLIHWHLQIKTALIDKAMVLVEKCFSPSVILY